MPPEKRKPEEEPEAAKSPAVSTHEVTQPSAPPPTQATSSEGASGSPERADKSDVHGTKAGAENANEEHDARENSDGEEAKMKTQHRSSVTRENQVKAGIEENRHPVKEALKDSPNHDSQSPEVTSKAVSSGDDVNDSLKSLKKRLSAALENVSGKEDSVKQLSKVAEEAVAGWEKAENEVASLKPHLEAAVRQLRQLKGDIANAKDGVSQKENGELQAQLAFCSPVVIPLEVCTTSSENPSLIKTRSLDTKGSEDVEAGGVGGDDEEDEEDDEEEEDDEDDEEEEDHEEEEDEEDHEEEEDDEDDEEEEDDEEDVEDEEPLHLIFAQNVVAGGVVGDDEEDVEDEEPLHLIFAQNVEAGGVVGDDVEDVEDEEPLRYVYPLRYAYRFEDQIRVYYVYYTAPEMRFERLNPIGDISLSAHRDIHEVHREVWRIIFTFVSNVEFLRSRPREVLFFWYIRYTEDDRWEYLSRHAWCWPWDRFFREADGVVVTHHDPEPQLLPALGDNVIYGEADGVVGDDEEDVEDEEPLHLVNLFERRIMVYHVYYTAPEMRSERLDLVGDINLDNYGDINEVHQEVWRIVKMLASNVEFFTDRPRSALFGCRIELFGWYIRFTEDGGWEYLSRRACDWPWDRFYREADGVVVSHEDPEPQVRAL